MFIACKRFVFTRDGESIWSHRGMEIPEAEFWPNINRLLRNRFLRWVPDKPQPVKVVPVKVEMKPEPVKVEVKPEPVTVEVKPEPEAKKEPKTAEKPKRKRGRPKKAVVKD